jgi:hypothetical protein
LLNAVRRDDGLPLDFERVRPTPSDEYLENLGVDVGFGAHAGWLLWRDAYWGTKWSPEGEDFRLEGAPEDGKLTFFFQTASGVPIPLIEELARQHLGLSFTLVYVDHGQYIAGGLYCRLGMRALDVQESREAAAGYFGSPGLDRRT